jgi:F-type H+-transporting ATPase subunit epsilon
MADARLHVLVVTPEKPVFDGEADMIVVPAHDGELGILPRHARLLSSLGLGTLRVRDGRDTTRWFLEGGFVQVRENLVTILCEHAIEVEDLDVEQAEREAEQAKREGRHDATSLQQRAVVMRRVQSRTSAAH